MRRYFRGGLLLAGACMAVLSIGRAQTTPSVDVRPKLAADLAVTYNIEQSELAPGNCGCFWLQGGGVDAAVSLRSGIGIAAGFSTGRAANVAPGIDVEKVQYVAGPRYTYTAHGSAAGPGPRLQLFGQALFGGVHAYNGAFPSPTGLNSEAGSYAIEAGGGANVLLGSGFGLRVIEVDYVRNALPNNGSNTQNDARIAFGVTWRFRVR